MDQTELLDSVDRLYSYGKKLINEKNNDYADPKKDAFRNFRSCEVIGLNPKQAILVRVLDKISRIGNLLNKENSVKSENISDSIVDSCNYLAILNAYIEDENKTKEKIVS